MAEWTKGEWIKGFASWREADTMFMSIAFTWLLPQAKEAALKWRSEGFRVRAGGPAVFARKKYLEDVAELGGDVPDAVAKHNPMATFASRGCPVGCYFCIVPAMEGRTFTLFPDFTPRPVLCDNNLSALPADYQDHIVRRYQQAGVPLIDANSGFEPRTFDEEVWQRWAPINKGPWRFAYDDQADGVHVERVAKMLAGIPARKKQVYVLIGNEPLDSCMDRIHRTISWGCEPYVQPIMKLNALKKERWVRYDWTEQKLRHVQRWVNGWVYRRAPFFAYDPSIKKPRAGEIEPFRKWIARQPVAQT